MKKSELIAQIAREKMDKSRCELGMQCAEWCAEFTSMVLTAAGITGVQSNSCNEMKTAMSNSNEWTEPENYPTEGDIIFFDWDGKSDPLYNTKPLDHVGIVDYFDESTKIIHYINGNGNSSSNVTEQAIYVDNPAVAYWMRYNDTDTANRKQEIYNTIKDLQSKRDELNNRINELINSLYTV